jgi:hypothetical protein
MKEISFFFVISENRYLCCCNPANFIFVTPHKIEGMKEILWIKKSFIPKMFEKKRNARDIIYFQVYTSWQEKKVDS